MKKIYRIAKNLFLYVKGVREIGDSKSMIFYKCLKCGTKLDANKGYGKLHVVCGKCGNSFAVYTGKKIYSINNIPKTSNRQKISPKTNVIKKNSFEKHILGDLSYLADIISYKRDLRKQASYRKCLNLLQLGSPKKGYQNVLRYLQKFCDLESVSIRLIWEPLNRENTFINPEHKVDIIGTCYPLKLNMYSIFLNPDFLDQKKILLSTLAHEISHVYTYANKLKFTSPDPDRGNKSYSEQMTDLLGIVLGMGNIIYDKNYKPQSQSIGYLTDEQVYISYKIWKSKFLTGEVAGIRTLIVCGYCSKKIRIPIRHEKNRKKNFKIVCPRCKKILK